MTHWTPYRPGQVLSGGAFKIASVIRVGETKDSTKYLIKYLCCGGKMQINHRHIDERNCASYLKKRRHRGLCRRCAHLPAKINPVVASPKPVTDEPVIYLLPPWYISPSHAWQRPVGVEPLPVWGMQP